MYNIFSFSSNLPPHQHWPDFRNSGLQASRSQIIEWFQLCARATNVLQPFRSRKSRLRARAKSKCRHRLFRRLKRIQFIRTSSKRLPFGWKTSLRNFIFGGRTERTTSILDIVTNIKKLLNKVFAFINKPFQTFFVLMIAQEIIISTRKTVLFQVCNRKQLYFTWIILWKIE